ncbi:tetratricopeptide repeat protein [Lentzea kentuckyensis]|uniref:tetratricopeptide repeat protein n=1 Tax=Lentzea kentuckyensis TaxID=360086 RepID=UPI000A387F89|nr:tetratricopeptide repeat protein [Lentzea kentuckyensis]
MRTPNPERARTLDELIAELRLLKVWAGDPSITTITRRIHRTLRAAGAPESEWPARATVGDCFRLGRRRPNPELVLAVVRSVVDDEPEVLRWYQALRLVLGEREIAGHVTVRDRLPADAELFTGRADLVTELFQAAGASAEVVVLAGMAGVGKTTLALHLGHRILAEHGDRTVLFADLRGFDPEDPPADPFAVLGSFLRLLGVSGERMPRTLDGRAGRYRQRLAGTKALVVLDNALDERQIEPLLPRSPDCPTLVTSRNALPRLDGVRSVSLPVLTPAEALTLLRRTAGADRADADPVAAERIADLLGRLPLAMSIIGGHLRDHPDWTLADYVPPLTALALEGGVRAALALSYRSLPDEPRRLLRYLARQPGQDLGVRAAAALAGQDVDTTEHHLRALVTAHLLERPATGRYGFHDLVRAYALERSRLEDPSSCADQAMTRLADHYRHGAAAAMDLLYPFEKHRRPVVATPEATARHGSPEDARVWLAQEEANLLAVAGQRNLLRHTADISALLWRFLYDTGNHVTALRLHHGALTASRLLGDRAGVGQAHHRLGAVCWRLGRFADALDHYGHSLDVARELGDRAEEGRAHNNIGIVYERQGRLSLAQEHYLTALDVAREVGDPASLSRTLTNIGNIHWGQGRHDEALAAHQEALVLARETGDLVNEARTLNNLGNVHRRRGHHAEALGYYERSLAALRGSGYEDEVGHTLTNVAFGRHHIGDHHGAFELLTIALAAARRAGNRVDESYALTVLGAVLRAQGRFAESVAHHRHAITIADEFVDHTVSLIALNNLGEALCASSPADAVKAHDAALALAEEAGDSYEQARAHRGLGDAHAAMGDTIPARTHWHAALTRYTDLNLAEASQVRSRLEVG